MSKHTPTPWPDVVYQNDVGPNDEGFWEWYEIPGIARFDAEGDANFALRACNAHNDFVSLLRNDVLPVVTNYRASHHRPGCICIICELPGMIRAALAKAGVSA